MNVLQNVFQKNGQQPWKQYYQGIKPSNPLGGNIRRMGNKVKPVVSSVIGGKTMQFKYMNKNNATFSKFTMDEVDNYIPMEVSFGTKPKDYIPPYKPLPGQTPYIMPISSPAYAYSPTSAANIEPTLPPGMTMQEYKDYLRMRREQERTERETRREARREISDARANYRTILDTAREGRSWMALGR